MRINLIKVWITDTLWRSFAVRGELLTTSTKGFSSLKSVLIHNESWVQLAPARLHDSYWSRGSFKCHYRINQRHRDRPWSTLALCWLTRRCRVAPSCSTGRKDEEEVRRGLRQGACLNLCLLNRSHVNGLLILLIAAVPRTPRSTSKRQSGRSETRLRCVSTEEQGQDLIWSQRYVEPQSNVAGCAKERWQPEVDGGPPTPGATFSFQALADMKEASEVVRPASLPLVLLKIRSHVKPVLNFKPPDTKTFKKTKQKKKKRASAVSRPLWFPFVFDLYLRSLLLEEIRFICNYTLKYHH